MSIPSTTHRLLGWLHPEWDLRVGPGRGPVVRKRGEHGVTLAHEARSGRIAGGAPIQEAIRCGYDGAHIDKPLLVGTCSLTSLRGARLTAPQAQPGARATSTDLTGATIERAALGDLVAVSCSFSEAIIDGELGELELCDFRHARLTGVTLRSARACDFTAASLQGCKLAGADLRGARFARADLRDCDLAGANVQDADFAAATGLSGAQKKDLVARGARLRGAAVVALVRRFRPAGEPVQLHRLASVVQYGGAALAGVICLGAAALAVRPPPAPETSVIPPALERSVGADERAATQQSLRRLREALAQANATMMANGASQMMWPTEIDIQENRYDTDGEGPGEHFSVLVDGGLPKNHLTASQGGVLPYCNDVPTQETLQGVDTDWHYCDTSGRVFASAGFTEEPTLNW
ncbi:MAG: pentapeptide repeat-containing protein [Proteobacteria bacterium]|nr:pentapeptide repeat-containing protein [Pseudomonadota bacterium]MCP4919579.1 pentapeptide repeat-containing protein [Pseudomonadota bacterium]